MQRRPTRLGVEAAAAVLLATAVTDALGLAGVSFYLLVVAVPVAAVAGLLCLGEVVDTGHGRLRAVLLALLVAAVVLGAAAREPAIASGGVPPEATVALALGLVLLALQALLALAPIRR